MSECKHGYYCKDGTPCALCHEDELAALRAKLQEAVGIAHKFAEVARDVCIAGLAQSAKLRQAEVRIAELEAELLGAMREKEDVRRTATEDALKYSYNELSEVREASDRGAFISRAIKALLGEGEK